MISRTWVTTAKHIFTSGDNNLDYFKTQGRISQLLKYVISELDKRDDICHDFKVFKQANQRFTAFYLEFCCYISYFRYSEQDIINKLLRIELMYLLTKRLVCKKLTILHFAN